jgi:hypothetical protein
LTIVMRIHKLLALEFYWSNEWVFAVPQFKTLITQFHYQIIKSHLYFSNLGETHMYQLRKVCTFFNQFQTQCCK